jgi:hypothetical protein
MAKKRHTAQTSSMQHLRMVEVELLKGASLGQATKKEGD